MSNAKPTNTAQRVVPGIKDFKVHAYDEFDDDVERKVRIFSDFHGKSGDTLPLPFKTQDTSAAGSPTLDFEATDAPDGQWAMKLATTNEVETLTLYQGDILSIPALKGPILKARFAITSDVTGAGGAFAAGDKFVIGLATARNATLDSVTSHAWLRFEGANHNMLIETDDGTTDTDDKDSGLDWAECVEAANGTLSNAIQLKIDCTDLDDVKFWALREGVDTKPQLLNQSSGTKYTMSLAALTSSTNWQFFCEIQKAAAANKDHKVIFDYVDVTWKRS